MQYLKSLGARVSDALFIALVVIVAYTLYPFVVARDWLCDRAAKGGEL
jgi:hypothetical protein